MGVAFNCIDKKLNITIVMRALIVDDELNCRDNLKILIESYCSDITESETAASVAEARERISIHEPDVLFLDIKMPRESGFDLLESLNGHKMHVVFTTAHSEYVLRALKAEAVDYLEKPIDIDDLQAAVSKVKKRQTNAKTGSDWRALIREMRQNPADEKIAIPMRDGFEWISFRDIIHLEAAESYTTLYLTGDRKLLSSKNIAVYERKLDPEIFFRTHKSHIINMRLHLKSFSRLDGNSAVMSNGKHIPISRRKLQSFLDTVAGSEA